MDSNAFEFEYFSKCKVTRVIAQTYLHQQILRKMIYEKNLEKKELKRNVIAKQNRKKNFKAISFQVTTKC
jgi:hypothetical protein